VVVTLNHRNICQVFDVGLVKGQHYIAMELIGGISLRQLLRAAQREGLKLAPAIACYIVDEMLEALDYAHRAKDPRSRQADAARTP
jgi:eukaryotic-like serine/threonine-protein kinase